MPPPPIRVVRARTHNLKNVSVDIPRGAFSVITGPSGSGKSTLLFDVLHAEGQRRFVESLSAKQRAAFDLLPRPDADAIEGLPPTLALEQVLPSPNPRSTLGTTTEVYEFLRVLFARAGTAHCPECGIALEVTPVARIADRLVNEATGRKVHILAPMTVGKGETLRAAAARARKDGFVRIRVGALVHVIDEIDQDALDRVPGAPVQAVVDRVIPADRDRGRIADSIALAYEAGNGVTEILVEGGDGGKPESWRYLARHTCPEHGAGPGELTPALFSFNTHRGACPACDGIGRVPAPSVERIIPDPSRSLDDGLVEAWKKSGKQLGSKYKRTATLFAKRFGIERDLPFQQWPAKVQQAFVHGTTGDPAIDSEMAKTSFGGVLPDLAERWRKTDSEFTKKWLGSFFDLGPCETCKGARLSREARAVTLAAAPAPLGMADIVRLPVAAAAKAVASLKLAGAAREIAAPLVREIRARLACLEAIGLGYLTLDRQTVTLSQGEYQRARLAQQIGSGLVGVCYLLDEPTSGLHPRDTRKLIEALGALRDRGNTVVVVEHDLDVVMAADRVFDMGPGGGTEGGEIVAEGSPAEIRASSSPTGRALSAVRAEPKSEPRTGGHVEFAGCRVHNLRGETLRFPRGALCVVCGVSGSGKSSLVIDGLVPALEIAMADDAPRDKHGVTTTPFGTLRGLGDAGRLVVADAKPIGSSWRSNAATFTGMFDEIRRVFAATKPAQLRGFTAARFSFNVAGGRCEVCQGQGTRTVSMVFLPDVAVPCDACDGRRYNRETLEARFKGLTIADVLELTVAAALPVFAGIPKVHKPLLRLSQAGLGYVRLGQPAPTLSGGEAQRLKLAAELAGADIGDPGLMRPAVYVMDEPTSGLHALDVAALISVLRELVTRGNTVIAIEHHIDLILAADYIAELGPDGGEGGGRILFQGPPGRLVTGHDTPTAAALTALNPRR